MKIRDKNPELKGIINSLEKRFFEEKTPLWRGLARGLNRPRRKKYEVNLFRIERFAKARDTVVVPGIVLGTGEIKKSVDVAALKFTSRAREKIQKAGGSCFSIEELADKKIRPRDMRIMG